jgi:hypothetical protein
VKQLSRKEVVAVSGGEMNADACQADAVNGFAIGAAVGAAIGSNFGAAATAGVVGGLIGGALAVSNNQSCGTTGFDACAAAAADGFDTSQSGMCDSGGGGGGKVICTELCRNGVIEHEVWMADIRYSRENFSDATMRGYHLWGVPYVRLMRKSPAFAKLAEYPTRWFAEDIAYRMGVWERGNWKGWALRELMFRPICSVLGVFAQARDWQALFAEGKAAA